MQFILAITSCLAYQGGPIWWAVMHTRHHQNCDTPDDPHSATQQGFWYAWFGWMMNPQNYDRMRTSRKFINPKFLTPEMEMVQLLHPAPSIMLALYVKSVLGFPCMVWSVLLPMLVCRASCLVFNVHFHPEEEDGKCKAIDDGTRFLATVVGESQHLDHHNRPRRSRRPDMDIPWWLTLSWMEPLGIVWDCH